MHRLIASGSLLAILVPGCSASGPPDPDPRLEALSASCLAELEAIHAAGSFPGATAALVLPDGGVLRLSVGATEDQGRPLVPDDRMLVGSAGKTWVAGIVHLLVAKRAFDYDDQAAGWFAEDEWYARVPNADSVTIRQLLRHQSGLQRYEFKPEFWQQLMLDADRIWRPEELLAFVLDDEPMFPAGQGWAYADTNYILLGMIIERETGRRFYELAEEWIDRPHGLLDTIPSDRRRLPGLVQGTVVLGRQLGVGPLTLADGALTYNVQFEWCGGGFASTSTDLASWARVLYSERLLGADGLAAMLDVVPARELGPGKSYGLGVTLTETRLGPLRGHDGFMPGYLTAMGYFPESGIAAAVQVNTDDGRAVGMPMHEVLVRLAECFVSPPR